MYYVSNIMSFNYNIRCDLNIEHQVIFQFYFQIIKYLIICTDKKIITITFSHN